MPGETTTNDNALMLGTITVTIPGDVDGNRQVNIFDIVIAAGHYGESW
jgi:hypothetical protein